MSGLDWLDEIPRRPLLERGLEAGFALPPGDRALVAAGAVVEPGDPLIEHLRDRHIVEVDLRAGEDGEPPRAGARHAAPPGRRHRDRRPEGELLAPVPGRRDRWRMATGEHRDVVASPLRGEVTAVQPGGALRLRAFGPAIRGVFAAGSPARGRLELATDAAGELRAGAIDVGRAGSILVVGARIDAEALTRARAMGVRGVVTAALAGKELRDFQASERRQRAALHPAAPFGVLVLDGTVRRPIAAALVAILEGLAGTEVSLLVDPPALVLDAEPGGVPRPAPDWVRVRSGTHAGLEGRAVLPLGPWRFGANVVLEAARVAIDGIPPLDVPLSDLERPG